MADEYQQAVRPLIQSASGGNDEANLVDQLRDNRSVVASLVALTRSADHRTHLSSHISIITDDGPLSAVSIVVIRTSPCAVKFLTRDLYNPMQRPPDAP